MGVFHILLIALGLSMDAFAIAICAGLSLKKPTVGQALKVGLYFGGAQAVMPLLGYFLGEQFAQGLLAVSDWIVFALLGFIGAKMIYGSFRKDDDTNGFCLNISKMLPLAIITSIDAMAAGLSFAFVDVNILPAVVIIGVSTFILSAFGVWVGKIFGLRFKAKAELAGGVILVLMGMNAVLGIN